MKAIISSTFDDTYLFYLPITTWLWNKLDVDVICLMPSPNKEEWLKLNTVQEYSNAELHFFDAPEHKKATYAQCSRLYGACLDMSESEILVTSDVDMAVFKIPLYEEGAFTIFGSDLVPRNQYPMCYISAEVAYWRKVFQINGKSLQRCLDELLGDIECKNMRGNYWAKDQEEAHSRISKYAQVNHVNRARPGTQFSDHRCDRDDVNWRSYVNGDLIDAHLWRPGFEANNFNNIMELLKLKYPNDNFDWIISYRDEYIKFV